MHIALLAQLVELRYPNIGGHGFEPCMTHQFLNMKQLKAIVYVRERGQEHHNRIIEWLTDNVGIGNFRHGGYLLWSNNGHGIFHFCETEPATAFLLAFDGKINID